MTTELRPADGPIHTWFSFGYTNYQVLPRTLMQSMPIEWQQRMVTCLEEIRDAFEHLEQPETYRVDAATEHIVDEMGFDLLAEAGITQDWYGGEEPPQGLDAEDLAEWKAAHEVDAPTYRDRDGRELDSQERVYLPAADPIPHYNRGRTHLEPRLPDAAA
jgi:hypothetical protein